MLRKLKAFEYLVPTDLSEAVGLLAAHGAQARLFAGGTDLLVGMKETGCCPQYLVDVKPLPELHVFSYDEYSGLCLGAATTIRAIETSALVREKYPHLAQGAAAMASIQIRGRATIGGNICHASPCADTVPNLIVSGARVLLLGPAGCREVLLEGFSQGPGISVLASEVMVEIRVPPPAPRSYSRFARISRRKALDLALVSVAVKLELSDGRMNNVRVALGSVGPTVFRARETEAFLEGRRLEAALMEEAGRSAAAESKPIDDVRASAWYRREMVATLLQRSLAGIAEETRDGQ